MTSAIDASKPVTGSPTTQSVRDNFLAARNEIIQLQDSIGWADYNDTLTATTPISPTINTFTKLTNNGLGTNTSTIHLPTGVTSLWNASTNHISSALDRLRHMSLQKTINSLKRLERILLQSGQGHTLDHLMLGTSLLKFVSSLTRLVR